MKRTEETKGILEVKGFHPAVTGTPEKVNFEAAMEKPIKPLICTSEHPKAQTLAAADSPGEWVTVGIKMCQLFVSEKQMSSPTPPTRLLSFPLSPRKPEVYSLD